MKNFIVSLFGHREIDDLFKLEKLLFPVIKGLIQTKTYVSFFVGRNGEFDEYAASVIKRAQKAVGKENNEITLVLPYSVASIEYYGNYYDDIIIPGSLSGVHSKAAITQKNRWMVEMSDLVIVYVARNKGGAYEALKYAKKLNKNVINLCDETVNNF